MRVNFFNESFLCEYFNNLFDIFNSKSNDHYVNKNPLNQNSKSMDFLRLENERLNEFKCAYNGNDNLPYIIGWMANVKALISLSQDLIDKYALYELNTGNSLNHYYPKIIYVTAKTLQENVERC